MKKSPTCPWCSREVLEPHADPTTPHRDEESVLTQNGTYHYPCWQKALDDWQEKFANMRRQW